MLSEVVVKPKKEKYSRKNNPAVEFMKKVIENKKALKLEENDYYQYQKYEKMKMSLNDVTPDKMEKGIYKKFSFFKDQVEVSPKTNKMILPISIKETASKTIFRKNPKSEKTIIEGMNSTAALRRLYVQNGSLDIRRCRQTAIHTPCIGWGEIVASSVRRLVAVRRTSSPPVYSDGCCPVYIRGKQNGRTHIRLR